jgi:uncharacterized membrane protein
MNKPVFDRIELFMPLCLAISLCYLTFYYALDAGELSIASAILGTYPMYTVLFAVFVIGEVLVLRQWIALAVIMAGVGLLSYLCSPVPVKEPNGAPAKPAARGWLYLALSSSVLIGVADAMCKVIIDNTNVSAFSLYLNTMQIAAGIVLKLLFERRDFCFEALKSKYSLVGIFILNIGGLAFTLALSIGQASIIVPLSSSYLVIVTILSWLFLKEKMNALKIFAIAVVVAGIMAL